MALAVDGFLVAGSRPHPLTQCQLLRPQHRHHILQPGAQVTAVGAEGYVNQLSGFFLGGGWLQVGVVESAVQLGLFGGVLQRRGRTPIFNPK